jgi:phosphoribosylamine--glycine ligase
MAAGGYPADYRRGDVIRGLDLAAEMEELVVFHAGTAMKEEAFVTNGGRVLGVTALGKTVGEAIDRAYRGVSAITWDGVHYRRDIGAKALNR